MIRVAAGCQPAADAGEHGAAYRKQRPDTADQHGADTQVTDPGTPERIRQRSAVFARAQFRIHEPGAVNRDRDAPADEAADEHQRGDVQPDDVTDAEQGRRHIGARIEHGVADITAGLCGCRPQLQPGLCEFHEAAGQRRDAKYLQAGAGFVAGAQDFGGRFAFGERQALLHDQ